jgi:ribosomal-protein-alanine N-acetyltransferase
MSGPETISIEPAIEADVPALAALHGASFARGWDADAFTNFVADPACVMLVARLPSGGAPAGFVTARAAADEAEILTFTVAESARGRGVGQALIDALAARLAERGIATLFLEVGDDNSAARALYRRAGFRDAGRRPGYYSQGDGEARGDALILRRDLAG